jgi:Fe-S cluster assembly iron-binding protein IscA
MTEFAAEDVKKIAAALTKTAIEIFSEEDGGARLKCKLCDASVPWLQSGDTIKHQDDCAVVIAERILARPRPRSV